MTPIENAVHLCIDMQRIFAKGGIWETPWMERVLPTIAEISARYAERTIFYRFNKHSRQQAEAVQRRSYFHRWKKENRQSLGGGQLDLVPELARYVPPAAIIDKGTYSAFFRSPLANLLVEKQVRTIVVSGAETDVCVLFDGAGCGQSRLPRRDRGGRAVLVVGRRS